MITAVSKSAIVDILIHQLEGFFPLSEEEKKCIIAQEGGVFCKIENCFSHTTNKYYHRDNEVYFNPFHSGQYAIFLYYYSRLVYLAGNSILADKIYYLNKIMNGCDLFYEVVLPDQFSLDHPVGTVIGRAEIGSGFIFGANNTVGGNHDIYPVIEENCELCVGACVIGKCKIGTNVTVGAGCIIKDQDIPDNVIVFGESPNLIIKNKK